jgi:hypothetical protein
MPHWSELTQSWTQFAPVNCVTENLCLVGEQMMNVRYLICLHVKGCEKQHEDLSLNDSGMSKRHFQAFIFTCWSPK